MRILGIESSCDETAFSVLEVDPSGGLVEVVENLVSSQVPIHQQYGGVVPEIAARTHVLETVALFQDVVSRQPLQSLDLIAVTRGPGLPTALQVGVEAARMMSFLSGVPVMGVNHLEGHLASSWLKASHREQWQFPLLALVVSGGHTELVLMKDFCDYEIIGETRDDAAGEAFDKCAKLIGLPYPGGPEIAKLALKGSGTRFGLPRPMLEDPSLDFSFSGLKTAVRQTWELCAKTEQDKADLAASVQEAIVDVLVKKTMKAVKQQKVHGVLVVGGVSANVRLREVMELTLKEAFPKVAFLPSDRQYITDNAAMIAAAGYWRWRQGERQDWRSLDIDPNLGIA